MYDPIIEEDPWVQGYGDKREARGEAKGEASGIRRIIEKTVRKRFPNLKELVMERVASIQNLDVLEQVLDTLYTAPDEHQALRYLQAL